VPDEQGAFLHVFSPKHGEVSFADIRVTMHYAGGASKVVGRDG
jgi:hypothetical protein